MCLICSFISYKNTFHHSCLPLLFTGLIAISFNPAYAEPELYKSSWPNYSAQKNLWLVPQNISNASDRLPEAQQFGSYYGQSDTTEPSELLKTNNQNSGDRYVTPEILESLRQQQAQSQMLPDNIRSERQFDSRIDSQNSMSVQPGLVLKGYGTYLPQDNSLLYNAETFNPLYETPAVSPWGSGIDVLNFGESFPLIPSEAIGGVSPMYKSSYGMNNFNKDASGRLLETGSSKVFNPFTFLLDNYERSEKTKP